MAEQEEFLAQIANNEDASTVQQQEPDPLVTLIQPKLVAGEDIRDLLNQMQDQAVQRALAAAALQKPIKRKAARRNSEEASTWASHPGNEAVKRRIFSMPSHDPTPSIPGLGGTMVAPPNAHHLRERFRTAAQAMPAAIASTPMRPVVETE